jgi:hypothetical protein
MCLKTANIAAEVLEALQVMGLYYVMIAAACIT